MTQTLATREKDDVLAGVVEDVVMNGDLTKLSPERRVAYYRRVCQSLGLNELTKPFDYITLNNKLTLYATRTCTDQLRKIHGVSIARLEKQTVGEIHFVTAYATAKDGRSDCATGAVNLRGLGGEGLANAYMKCETKAKRRVTLSICGLGWLDETEVETVPAAETAVVDMQTGEITGYVPIKDQTPTVDRPRSDRRLRMLERYGTLLSQARNNGLIGDASRWVLPRDTSDDELEHRGAELADLLREHQRRLDEIAAEGGERED